jgi:hypothetical protein
VEAFPANSHNPPKAAQEDSKELIKKVVVGDVVVQKKPLGRRIMDTFFGGDARGVVGYVMTEVLLPAARDTIADAVSQGVERLIFGEARSTSRRTGGRPNSLGGAGSYVSYNRYSSGTSGARREEPRDISRRARSTHDFDEIILATRVEAQTVIDRLFDLVSQYEMATVSDLYELVGLNGSYTDEKWGWIDLRGASITRVRNGYLLDLPRPEQLNK